MTQLFRSKSLTLRHHTPLFASDDDSDEEEYYTNPISTPLIDHPNTNTTNITNGFGFPILVEALRKSLLSTCSSVGRDDDIDIGWPTDVEHVSHVTFDRFNGFLGLPLEFKAEVPSKVPSASVNVFGVSAGSMQCSYDQRGNSVPTILLMMQNRLYSEGGLQAEGIFRINADNSQVEYVRDQLNTGIVPQGIDVHCLAGFIKAWFRELPTGVLDSLTPDQVMHCNTEEECSHVVRLLPPTESTLLDWAINLMADVVHHEHYNKMNARNIAMVFAPNMTQMADPLTALIHAVQVMNLLKTLILKTLRERGESLGEIKLFFPCSESPIDKMDFNSLNSNNGNCEQRTDICSDSQIIISNFTNTKIGDGLESESESFRSFQKKVSEADDEHESVSGHSTPVDRCIENQCKDDGSFNYSVERLSWRNGVRKLCSHPVFQLSKPIKKMQASAL